MRKRFGEWPRSCILFFVLASLLQLPACTVLHTTTENTIVRESARIDGADNVWMIDGMFAAGSGFPVSCEPTEDGSWRVLFLTANHVAHDYEMIFTASHSDGRELDGALLSEHDVEDAAVLEFISDFPVAMRYLSRVPVEFGERLVLSGYPGNEGPFVFLGIASVEGLASFHSFPGTSGGPVARRDGSVVGIDLGVFVVDGDPVWFMSGYLPVTRIQEWLAELCE